MCKALIIYFITIACLNNIANAGRPSNSRSFSYGNRNKYGSQLPPQIQPQHVQTPKDYLDSKADFSTFGIISLIFAVIVACLVFYYGIMCYPLLCRDQKKYIYMDGSSMITTATSPSIQSIERYPSTQKQ